MPDRSLDRDSGGTQRRTRRRGGPHGPLGEQCERERWRRGVGGRGMAMGDEVEERYIYMYILLTVYNIHCIHILFV